jgi:hypothetical protein
MLIIASFDGRISMELRHLATFRTLATTLRKVVENILRMDVAHERSEIIQQAFPLLRELMQIEIRKGFAQLRADMREDMHTEIINEVRRLVQVSENRLVRLIVRVAGDTGVIRRFLYALAARVVDGVFAREAYNNAQEKAAKELTTCTTSKK